MKDLDTRLEGPGRPPNAPLPPVRCNRFLAWWDNAWAWLDGCLGQWLPTEYNPLAQAGRAANFALMVAVVSGVAMLLWYSPSVQFAYSSLDGIKGRTLGGVVRAVHRYSSDLVMVLLFVHAFRVFAARKFSAERWIAWVSGIALIALIWFIGWTGYWLVWDQPAQQVAVSSMRLMDGLPIFGEPMGRLFLADRLVPSLLFFVVFFLHMVLPLGIAIGLVVHLLRLSRVTLFPSWRLGAALTGGLLIAAILIPAPLDEAADMAVKAKGFTVDAWYMTPLALGLRFQHAGLWVALFGTWALGASVPWLLGRRRKKDTYQAAVVESRCHSCSQCSQDCPYDAITLVPRTDGKRFPSVAWIDPVRCVGCGVCAGSCDSEGIGLEWFDTMREEARIEGEYLATVAAGGSTWVSFVAGEIDGGIGLYKAEAWKRRLANYQVFVVPTASWVRPKFVERLMKGGASGVLVLRDVRLEAAARDGNAWVLDRMNGTRGPEFRPNRTGDGGGVWAVLDFDPARIDKVVSQAEAFRKGVPDRSEKAGPIPVWRMALAGLVLLAALLAVAIGPSHLQVANPAPTDPEFVFSFKAFGDFVASGEIDEAAELAKPIHMRGRSTEKPHRAVVAVRLLVDGAAQERSYTAKGISNDGPAIGEWRMSLAKGEHLIRIELQKGPESEALVWEGTLEAEERRIQVLTYEPGDGFRVE